MKIAEERKVVTLMIEIYYKKHPNEIEKQALLDYVNLRLNKCPFGDKKTFCSNCKVHCYQKEMRTKIKEVMRFSGPRMLFYHPIIASRHLIESIKEKRKHGKK